MHIYNTHWLTSSIIFNSDCLFAFYNICHTQIQSKVDVACLLSQKKTQHNCDYNTVSLIVSRCEGECSVTGDMFFQSFDGRIFTFPASCQYVLAKSSSSGRFTVTIQNTPCGPVSLFSSCMRLHIIVCIYVTNTYVKSYIRSLPSKAI